MLLLPLLIAATSLAAAPAPLRLRALVTPQRATVTLGELLTKPARAGLDAADRAQVIVRVPAKGARLPAAALARLIQRRLPGVVVTPPAGALAVVIAPVPSAGATAARVTGQCYRAARALGANVLLTGADIRRGSCDAGAAAIALTFDRAARDFRTTANLPADAYLGRPTGLGDIVVGDGAALTLRVRQGPAIIEREVVTLEPGRSGRYVFVRTKEGAILSAPLAANEAAR